VALPFDPADLHLHVQVGGIALVADPGDGLAQLIHADRVGIRHDGPIVPVAVDARDLVGGELKDLELDAGAGKAEPAPDGGEEEE